MKIEYISIKNFRGLNIEISSLERNFLIMGRNDTGKSNICYAIRKILDPLIRRIPLLESDSSSHNKKDIEIALKIDVDGLNSIQRSKIGGYINSYEGHEYIYVVLKAVYNDELLFYEEKLCIGEKDIKELATNKTNDIDKVLDVIYIEPNYNYEKTVNNYFTYKKKKNDDNQKIISSNVLEQAKKMNIAISSDDIILEMTNEINQNNEFNDIFENMKFDITSTIEISNIYKSLDITFIDQDGNNIGNMGDGKVKTLSMLLKKSSYDKEKSKIIIVEEPENHMYPLLQKSYTRLVENLGMDQFIFTTHSPYIFDLKKMDQIIRLIKVKNETTYRAINIDENTYSFFGYMMNEEIGEILFYDIVLLVEGVSEKYFYNLLLHNDKKFMKFCSTNNMGIFCVSGVDFYPVKKLLGDLGIRVMIKTDNDIFKVPKISKKRYAGIERVIDCLDDKGKKELANILGIKKINKETFRFDINEDVNNDVEIKMEDIQNLFFKYDVFLSVGHNGFEEDFLEFISEEKIPKEDLDYLKKAKLKNFHRYIIDSGIDVEINDRNKSSILVRFINEK